MYFKGRISNFQATGKLYHPEFLRSLCNEQMYSFIIFSRIYYSTGRQYVRVNKVWKIVTLLVILYHRYYDSQSCFGVDRLYK